MLLLLTLWLGLTVGFGLVANRVVSDATRR
jgi:hypothetical protein